MERLFLEHVYRWLKRAGVLVMVIPGRYIQDCSAILAHQFRGSRPPAYGTRKREIQASRCDGNATNAG